MESALPVIRVSSLTERAARWSLLLQHLRREGDAGTAELIAFLATGEDLSLGPSLELPGIKASGPNTLRAAVFESFSWSQDPNVRSVVRNETLRSLQSVDNLGDALRYIGTLEYLEPGTHRADAIAALQRIAQKSNPDPRDLPFLVQAIGRFGAVELLPLAEARAMAQPTQGLGNLFGALWRVPPEWRQEITDRILANSSLVPVMKDAMPKLDYRLPTARGFALAWFQSNQPTTAKARVIEQLGSARDWTPNSIFQGDTWNPDPAIGTPGTPAQAESRLSLLDEVAAILSDPFIEEKLAKARAALQEQIARSR
jgi:hypothetical protein